MGAVVRYPGLEAAPAPPLRKEAREAKVKRLQLTSQGTVTLELEEPFIFTAVPLDGEGKAVQGLTAEWESSAPGVVKIGPDGEAVAVAPGEARLTAHAGGKHAVVDVLVTQSTGEKFGGKKKTSKREDKKAARPETGDGDFRFVKASYGDAPTAAHTAKSARRS
jgi:hypothetical protein